MTAINYFLVSTALFIGILTAYEDIKFGKIRNKWILVGLFIGMGTHLSLMNNIFSVDYVLKVYLNAGIALLLGYLIWRFNGWSAGDAKLFFIFSLLLPLKFYWRSWLPIFPSLVILINTFVPLLIFIFGRSVFGAVRGIFLFLRQNELEARSKEGISNLFQRIKKNYRRYLGTAARFFLAFVVFQLVRLEGGSFMSRFAWGQAGLLGLMVFLGIAASRAFKNKKSLIAVAVAIAFYLLLRQIFYSKSLLLDIVLTAKGSILYLTGLGLLFWLFSFYERVGKSKGLHFAWWLFLGLILTMAINGSVLMSW